MSRMYTYLYENDEIEYQDDDQNIKIKTSDMEFIVKTKPAEVLTANAGGVTTQADELERFLPKADGFMIYIYKGDIKKGLKRSRRLNIWRRLKSKDTRIALQGYEKTSGGKNIFKAIQRHRHLLPEKASEFLEVMVKYGHHKGPNIVEIMDPNAVDLAVQKFTIDELVLKPL